LLCNHVEASTHFSGKSCRLRRSTQHFFEVYAQEFGSLKFSLGVDSSAERPGRPELERWEKSPLLAGSIAAGVDSYFRSSHAAKDFANRRSKLHIRRHCNSLCLATLDSRIRLVIYSRNEASRPKSAQSMRATSRTCPPPAASGMLRNSGRAGRTNHTSIPCEERCG
jgi:hypothetical protein